MHLVPQRRAQPVRPILRNLVRTYVSLSIIPVAFWSTSCGLAPRRSGATVFEKSSLWKSLALFITLSNV